MSSIEIRFFTETMPAPEYNCSEHTPEEWTELYGTPRFVLGIWSIVFALLHFLYVPSIRVFNRERKLTSYKIMFNLALADLGEITCVGSLFGYAMIRGFVFCSDTTLAWLIGYPVVCFWYVSSTNCILLVINRISELTDHAQAFKGWPSTLCLAISIVYANMGMLFTRPVLFNSAIQTLAFDPLIPGHTMDEYPNTHAIIHDVVVFFSVPSLYLLMCTIVRSTSMQHLSTTSTATQVMQAKIFMQATIICCANTGVAAAWTIQMFIVPSPIVIVDDTIFLRTIFLQTVHGIPCIIYVILNNSVRLELFKMIGVNTQKVTNVSAFTSMHSQSTVATPLTSS